MPRKSKQPLQVEQKRARLLMLARMKLIERKTDEECAQALKVSDRTIRFYKSDPMYAEVIEEAKTEWKAGAEFTVAGMAQKVLSTMYELLDDPKSGHVRFEAAAKLGDWLGIGLKEAEDEGDQRSEVERITKILEERRPIQVNVFGQGVQPGGFLPEGLQRTITAEDFLSGRAGRKTVDAGE
jgi:hypothetical protein